MARNDFYAFGDIDTTLIRMTSIIAIELGNKAFTDHSEDVDENNNLKEQLQIELLLDVPSQKGSEEVILHYDDYENYDEDCNNLYKLLRNDAF